MNSTKKNEKSSNLVPMRAGTAHVIRVGPPECRLSAQVTAQGGGIPIGLLASYVVAVCSHVDCAGKTWRFQGNLEADHANAKQPHAWGWFHDGKLYASADAEDTRRRIGDPIPAAPDAGTVYDKAKALAEREINKALGVPLWVAEYDRATSPSADCGRALGDALATGLRSCSYCAGRSGGCGHCKPFAVSGPIGRTCPACGAEERKGAGSSVAKTVHRDDCRVVREAPLVALVANVPEGLDANGWRAAVLAFRESIGVPSQAAEQWAHCKMTDQLRANLGTIHTGGNALLDIVGTAYLRAIAPCPRPKPERKIGGRAVRLVLDHGED